MHAETGCLVRRKPISDGENRVHWLAKVVGAPDFTSDLSYVQNEWPMRQEDVADYDPAARLYTTIAIHYCYVSDPKDSLQNYASECTLAHCRTMRLTRESPSRLHQHLQRSDASLVGTMAAFSSQVGKGRSSSDDILQYSLRARGTPFEYTSLQSITFGSSEWLWMTPSGVLDFMIADLMSSPPFLKQTRATLTLTSLMFGNPCGTS